MADIVNDYRRKLFEDGIPFVYPVNAISANAYQASLALGKSHNMAIRVLFDPSVWSLGVFGVGREIATMVSFLFISYFSLETAQRRLTRWASRLAEQGKHQAVFDEAQEGAISKEEVVY